MSIETKTYRGATLEAILPQIREELGPDAIITRRRDGVVGGIGGFFGKRCVEVEARASSDLSEAPTRVVPARHAFDVYDSAAPDADAAPDSDEDAREEGFANPVIQRLIEQATPFADHLAAAAKREDADVVAAAPEAEEAEEGEEDRGGQPLAAVPAPAAEPAAAVPARRRRGPVARLERERAAVCARLVELGLPQPVVDALARDVDQQFAPFEPAGSYEDQMRRALAGQIRVRHGWRTRRRTIALVGPAGAGKTLAAAKLCHAYATASSLSVGTLSLESTADAYRLGTLTEALDVDIRVADTAAQVERAAGRMAEEDLVVVDTPPVSPADPEGIEHVAALLAAARVDETHLVLPAGTDVRAARALLEALAGRIDVSRVLFTRLDELPTAAVPVGLSLQLRRPISYLTRGRAPETGLRPADPAELAAMSLPPAEGDR